MTLYQILNFQFDRVKVFATLDEAKRHIDSLQEVYKEAFYVVEWPVVHFAPERASGK